MSRRWTVLCWLTIGTAALGNAFVGPTPEYGASSFLVAPWWTVTEQIVGVLTPLIILASVIEPDRAVHPRHGDRTPAGVVARGRGHSRDLDQCADHGSPSLPGRNILLLLSFPLIPAAVTIAVLRHGLYDVRIVVSRLVVYVLLTAGVIAVYVGLVAVLDQVLRGAGAPVVAALAIALAFNPVRVRLQRLVDRAGLRRSAATR